jgi:nitric oxide reductase subunit B
VAADQVDGLGAGGGPSASRSKPRGEICPPANVLVVLVGGAATDYRRAGPVLAVHRRRLVITTSTVRPDRRGSLVGKSWVQAAALVALTGLFVLVLMGWLAYQSHPPIPQRVGTDSGRTLYTGDDIRAGQDAFLRYGLMEFGSIFGHGAYLGPDFTADYLHRSAEIVQDIDGAGAATRDEFKRNRLDANSGTLTVSDAQGRAFDILTEHYATSLGDPRGETGLRPSAITDPPRSGH